MKQLNTVFVYHFNQIIYPDIELTSKNCYEGILTVMRKHPTLKFVIHLSGVVISGLQWYNPRIIDLVREGLKDGQFELLGSTYAQNIMLASDSWDNQKQIEQHRQIIEDVFGITPAGFWNPERCWSPEFVDLLKDNGYRYTFIETPILEKGGVHTGHHRIFHVQNNDNQLVVFNDDQAFMNTVDFAYWTGLFDPAFDHMEHLYNEDKKAEYVLCYAQDAEASGQWGYNLGRIPHQAWANMDAFFTRMEKTPWIKVTSFEEILENNPEIHPVGRIEKGQARWMVQALLTEGAAYHEPGYKDWFDYITRAPKFVHFNKLYSETREKFLKIEQTLAEQKEKPGHKAATRLFQQAVLSFAVHQFEYGCVGFGYPGFVFFEMVRTALVPLRAAELALNSLIESAVFIEDINNDGIEEIIYIKNNHMLVFSDYGGRLIYWFNLLTGRELIGNENTFLYHNHNYDNDNFYIPAEKFPPRWFPQDTDLNLERFKKYAVEKRVLDFWYTNTPGAADYKLKNFKESDTVSILERQIDTGDDIVNKEYIVRRRALNDFISINGKLILTPPQQHGQNYTCKTDHNEIEFSKRVSDELEYHKIIRITDERIIVNYLFGNLADKSVQVELKIENGFSPDYLNIMKFGDRVVKYKSGEQLSDEIKENCSGVVNTRSGTEISLEFHEKPDSVAGKKVFMGIEINPVYRFQLGSKETKQIQFELK